MASLKDRGFDGPRVPKAERRRRELVLLGLFRATQATFTQAQWQELGLLTGTASTLDSDPRLYRSLSWGDDDYPERIIAVLPKVLGDDFENERAVVDFVGLESWLRENDPAIHMQLYGGSIDLKPEDLTGLDDPGAIEDHLIRLRGALVSDPAHAIGVAKELIESTAKLVLRACNVEFDERFNIQGLVKNAQKALGMDPAAFGPTTKGDEAMRKMLSGLSSTAIGVAELRNEYGTGHGKADRVEGLQPRHARIAADAASTWCRAMLAALDDR